MRTDTAGQESSRVHDGVLTAPIRTTMLETWDITASPSTGARGDGPVTPMTIDLEPLPERKTARTKAGRQEDLWIVARAQAERRHHPQQCGHNTHVRSSRSFSQNRFSQTRQDTSSRPFEQTRRNRHRSVTGYGRGFGGFNAHAMGVPSSPQPGHSRSLVRKYRVGQSPCRQTSRRMTTTRPRA